MTSSTNSGSDVSLENKHTGSNSSFTEESKMEQSGKVYQRTLSESSKLSIKETTAHGLKSYWMKVFDKRYRKSKDPKTRVIDGIDKEPETVKPQKPGFSGNKVSTSKYNIITFLPKNLFEQFNRFANIYFVSVIFLNWCPRIGAFGKEIAMVPVLFVLSVTMVKDFFEDRRRRNSDKVVNNSKCMVWSKNKKSFLEIKWKDLRVGQIIELVNEEIIPADVLVIKSSDQDGICYVETTNLDGESNLKQRQVVNPNMGEEFNPQYFKARLEVTPPSSSLNSFSGTLIRWEKEENEEIIECDAVALNKENLLLRGCKLRNTRSIQGIVLYAGHDTKALLNNSGPRYKLTALERMVNREVVWCIIMLVSLCFLGAGGSTYWLSSYKVPYSDSGESDLGLLENDPSFGHFIILTMTYVIILQILIPLSLYVTIELTKLMQIYFIQNDVNLYDSEYDKKIQCRALNITEDLGQIEYMFSDKTGTLTENKMIFRRCIVNGMEFNHMVEEDATDNNRGLIRRSNSMKQLVESKETVNEKFIDFLTNMAICNTVVVAEHVKGDNLAFDASPEVLDDGLYKSKCEPNFEAESPDELALVFAALSYGFELLDRTPNSIKFSNFDNGTFDYELVHVFPFDSDRKRMSIIVVDENKNFILYSKGADSVILPRIRSSDDEIKKRVADQIDNYAKEGLRTLVLAKKVIPEAEYKTWFQDFRGAELDMDNREVQMTQCYNVMEQELELLGATGIEDRLQEQVPETIENLRLAGIIIWVLTGDKLETAVNVAYSCRLLTAEMHQLDFLVSKRDDVKGYLQHFLDLVKSNVGRKQFSLVIDGNTMEQLEYRNNLMQELLELAGYCSAVLCCRLTPKQKQQLVKLVKMKGFRTLAIGDGANDVSMIQEADVGIGISGKEGMQAVMASDFAISKFKFLERLLLVHGHWCYDRLARLILYFFYKNACFVFVIFWYQATNGWSGGVMIEDMYLMVFNLFFTSLPPMAIGIIDQDAPSEILLENPGLYVLGKKNKVHTAHAFWVNMIDALYQSLVIFLIAFWTYSDSAEGITEFGTTVTASCVYTMLLHMAIETKSWTFIHILSIVVSLVAFYAFGFFYDSISIYLGYGNSYWVLHMLTASPTHWLVIFASSVLALVPRFSFRIFQSCLFPSAVVRTNLAQPSNKVINRIPSTLKNDDLYLNEKYFCSKM